MRKNVQPIVIQVLGASGRIKDLYMGILVDGNAKIINGIDTMEELLKFIKTSGHERYVA
jgi:hypothetical protein